MYVCVGDGGGMPIFFCSCVCTCQEDPNTPPPPEHTHLRPRRVHEPCQAQKHQPALQVPPLLRRRLRPARRHHRRRLLPREHACREGQHPQPALGQRVHVLAEAGGVAIAVVKGHVPRRGADVRAEGQEGLEGPLRQEVDATAAAAAAGAGAAVAAALAAVVGHDHAHALDAAFEGELGDEGELARAQQLLFD
jgi:hypothetical protein